MTGNQKQQQQRNKWYYFLPFYYLALLIVLSIFGIKISEWAWGATGLLMFIAYVVVVLEKKLSKWLLLLMFLPVLHYIAYILFLFAYIGVHFVRPQNWDEKTDTLSEPLRKCGGCGNESLSELQLVHDKKDNRGYLCTSCKADYEGLLKPDSLRNFWMCGACGFRILAGTRIDAEVDEQSNKCPNCGADVNLSLVNLSGDRAIGRGLIGEPVE